MKPARHVYMVQRRFVLAVRAGTKSTTIRLPRKRMPRAGDIADLRTWSGKPYRSKQIKLREHVITGVCDFSIEESGDFLINGSFVAAHLREVIAQVDGFENAAEMVEWFRNTHGLPFSGFATEWRP